MINCRAAPTDPSATDKAPERLDTSSLAPQQYADYLTLYEKNEIKCYPDIYYVGQKCSKKVSAPTSGVNDGYDSPGGEYIIVPQDHLAYRYEVVEMVGSGAFGQVVKAIDHSDGGVVAVKIILNKKKVSHQAHHEIEILQHIKEKDPNDMYGLVRMYDHFSFRNHVCIVYEILGANLYDRMKAMNFRPMMLSEVKQVAARVLVSLAFLWKESIIHCDLKPENILIRSEENTKVKVVDLGSACYDSQCMYTYIQSRYYRAPEIIMGLPCGRPIDLWSYGCILCELATAYPLFAGEDDRDQLFFIMEYLGVPDNDMIRSCRRKKEYFNPDFTPKIGPNSKGKVRRPSSKTLASFLKLSPDHGFISFLMQFLVWDPAQRVSPREAMRHPWIADEFVAKPTRTTTSAASTAPTGTTPSVSVAAAMTKTEAEQPDADAQKIKEMGASARRNENPEHRESSALTKEEATTQKEMESTSRAVKPNAPMRRNVRHPSMDVRMVDVPDPGAGPVPQMKSTTNVKERREGKDLHTNGKQGGEIPKSPTPTHAFLPRSVQRFNAGTTTAYNQPSAMTREVGAARVPSWQRSLVQQQQYGIGSDNKHTPGKNTAASYSLRNGVVSVSKEGDVGATTTLRSRDTNNTINTPPYSTTRGAVRRTLGNVPTLNAQGISHDVGNPFVPNGAVNGICTGGAFGNAIIDETTSTSANLSRMRREPRWFPLPLTPDTMAEMQEKSSLPVCETTSENLRLPQSSPMNVAKLGQRGKQNEATIIPDVLSTEFSTHLPPISVDRRSKNNALNM